MADSPDPLVWRRVTRRRLALVAGAFFLWVAGIQARLVYLQVYQHAGYAEKASNQQEVTVTLRGQRGDLLDRNGRVLAYSVDAPSIAMNPQEVESPEAAAATLCTALGDCTPKSREALAERLAKRDRKGAERHFAWVSRQVTTEQAKRVEALHLKGLSFARESRRWYPNRELAAHLLGYVGLEDKGRAGIEARFDEELHGRGSRLFVQRDGFKSTVFRTVGEPPEPGATLELTIDAGLQHLVERELRAGVIENDAEGGAVIAMDPRTGEILAMASYPTFNPNSYALYDPDALRDRAVQGLYEPGSTFKIVTVSVALDEHVVRPDTLINTLNGTITIPGRSRPVSDTRPHGIIPFSEVIIVSSNIGAIQVGRMVGRERLGARVKLFGFGTKLSDEFAYENVGLVSDPKGWSESSLASISMGYEIGVTPLQMAAAASAVANGGVLLRPRILRAVIRGDRREARPVEALHRVMSPGTAAELTSMMEGVVAEGTATRAQIPGFVVAGKTGTSQKNDGTRYLPNDYNASFVGFVPSRQPALTIIVVIDTPRNTEAGHQGGRVAAPVFSRIADAALRYLGIQPTINPPAPLLVPRRVSAERMVAGPVASLTISPPSPRTRDGQTVLPELRGLSGRKAVQVLATLGLSARLSGDGLVIEQEPAPGTPVAQGTTCRLSLARQARDGASEHQP